MKRLVWVLGVLLAAGVSVAAHGDDTGAVRARAVVEMLGHCERLQAAWEKPDVDWDMQDVGAQGPCVHFLTGVGGVMILYTTATTEPPHSGLRVDAFRTCGGRQATPGEVVQAFVNTVHDRPDLWQFGSIAMAMAAFSLTWPCLTE
jgi:hypothetical protein